MSERSRLAPERRKRCLRAKEGEGVKSRASEGRGRSRATRRHEPWRRATEGRGRSRATGRHERAINRHFIPVY